MFVVRLGPGLLLGPKALVPEFYFQSFCVCFYYYYYSVSLLVEAPLESWRCSLGILYIISCFFVIGFFCDLAEYQAAILHLKREHKEEIENLQVCLFDSIELITEADS